MMNVKLRKNENIVNSPANSVHAEIETLSVLKTFK